MEPKHLTLVIKKSLALDMINKPVPSTFPSIFSKRLSHQSFEIHVQVIVGS